RRRHTRFSRDWSSDVCSSDLHYGELDRQDIALLARGIVARSSMDSDYCAIRKGFGVELGGIQRGAVVPETNRVLADHFGSPEWEIGRASCRERVEMSVDAVEV